MTLPGFMPSTIAVVMIFGAVHASEMYARNVLNFVALFVKDGALQFDWDDELLAKTVWPERVTTAAVA